MIPLDFKGRIYVEFGTCWSRAIIKNNYFYRVEANANAQVIDYLQGAKIKISGNARIVYNPKTIH